MTAIRKRLGDFAAILALVVIAAAVGGYILANERLRFPFIQEAPFKLKAELQTAQAVTPGQGQTVRVAGVKIGDLAKVDLKNGRAIVTMDIDPEFKRKVVNGRVKGLIHTDAKALLRPKTGLKDMFIEIDPGTDAAPFAKKNWTIPLRNTLPDINPDEVLSVLDADSREYLKLLVNGAGRGLQNRGGDLQEVFRRFEPTHRDLARVTSAVAERRANLKRLIHSLNLLNTQLASQSGEVSELIEASSVVFRAFASEDQNISRAIADLPGTLRQTTITLGKVERFAKVLGPTADNLRPAVRALNRANIALRPFALEAAPILKKQIRPFVRDARPIVTDLKPAAMNLAKATPDLTGAFNVLNHLFNILGFNPKPGGGPAASGDTVSYLFLIAWLSHQGTNLFSSQDANGSYRPVFIAAPCQSLAADLPAQLGPATTLITGLAQAAAVC
ncbi:MAG: phospholipid/cholesterol/gamma-HCH transport system substrate-binding protein [Solirubrobacteraceae bacterium]|nr:phospholipid/cholesterol/gamma-HCH transport system substrate-binding protein [Solirubrobacteraceae bacterium]